jgi:nucleotide-binding universal stress UspA family protein
MQRILVAIDFSDTTPGVIDLARQLAKGLYAEVHLVYVKELRAAAAPEPLGYGLAGIPELAPMSGVPAPYSPDVPNSSGERRPEVEACTMAERNRAGRRSKSHCMSRPAPWLRKF